MIKRILFSMFVLFSFVKFSKAQSHAYVYISPDYGGCLGKMIIVPVCIDLPQPVTLTANIGGNTQSGVGPWSSFNLCNSIVQFTLTAVDGNGGTHILLNGFANLNPASPSVTYNTQSISSPLTIIHQMQPSGPMCNGTTSFQVTGGYAPYIINLLDATNNPVTLIPTPPNSYNAINLCPSNYMLTIVDNFSNPNCQGGNGPFIVPFTINFFDCIVATNDLTCAGICNGSAQLIPIGDFNISLMFLSGPSGNGTNSLSNQCPGTVTGTIIHTSGQQAMCMNQIAEPTPLNVSINTTNCSGFGINDGTATALVSGGTPGYSFMWDNGDTQATADSLMAGNVCVLVTDNNGCDTTVCTTITQPPQLIIQITDITHQTSTNPNGSVTFNITGGVAPYLAQLIRYAQNDTVASTFNNLAAGNYAIYVIDANGISATQPFTINNNISSGITQFSSNLMVKLYPNPARQQLTIEAPEMNLIEVYHMSGQKVVEQKINIENKVQLNIAELPSGSYFIKIATLQNQKTLSFIKQ
ncbi:MAG: T9SS type A sorting domain-containing protein [Bacteroidia bacterium]